jgi:glycine/D-amino acid oxidase-like deaminating enzyme
MKESLSIGIVGGGLIGKATALEIADRFDAQASITLYDNFQPSDTTRPIAPSHLGPIGLEVQSGNLWNSYIFGPSQGALHCEVEDNSSEAWLTEFARRSNDSTDFIDRQLELYLYNYEGISAYLSRPEYATHISQQGNLRLFRSPETLKIATDYVLRLNGVYEENPSVLLGQGEILDAFPQFSKFRLDDYAGAIFYPEDATGDSLKIQAAMEAQLSLNGIKKVSARIVNAESSSSSAVISSKRGKEYKHDFVLLCGGIENEEIASIDPLSRWTYPFLGRRVDLTPVESFGVDNLTIGLNDECFILRQATDNRIQVGGTVIIRDRELYRQKLWFDDEVKDRFVELALMELIGKHVEIIQQYYGIRAMTLDDLPYLTNPHNQEDILQVNPTGHLGFLQAPSVARRAVDYVESYFDSKLTNRNEDAFSGELTAEQIRRIYRRKGPKTQIVTEDRPTPRRGSRSNFVALRRQIVESGRGNAKKPMPIEQRQARRRKRK